jgi:hypothetical protein
MLSSALFFKKEHFLNAAAQVPAYAFCDAASPG